MVTAPALTGGRAAFGDELLLAGFQERGAVRMAADYYLFDLGFTIVKCEDGRWYERDRKSQSRCGESHIPFRV